MPNLFDFRCKQCNRLLGRVSGDSEISCPRCGGINRLSFADKSINYYPKIKKPLNSQEREHQAQLERISRRTSSGVTFR